MGTYRQRCVVSLRIIPMLIMPSTLFLEVLAGGALKGIRSLPPDLVHDEVDFAICHLALATHL
jgi:hypothetical protein